MTTSNVKKFGYGRGVVEMLGSARQSGAAKFDILAELRARDVNPGEDEGR